MLRGIILLDSLSSTVVSIHRKGMFIQRYYFWFYSDCDHRLLILGLGTWIFDGLFIYDIDKDVKWNKYLFSFIYIM